MAKYGTLAKILAKIEDQRNESLSFDVWLSDDTVNSLINEADSVSIRRGTVVLTVGGKEFVFDTSGILMIEEGICCYAQVLSLAEVYSAPPRDSKNVCIYL